MKAEDRNLIQKEILLKYPGTIPDMDIDWDMLEISFKAGMREVVEVVSPIMECLSDPILQRNWRKQLKEWRLDNE